MLQQVTLEMVSIRERTQMGILEKNNLAVRRSLWKNPRRLRSNHWNSLEV